MTCGRSYRQGIRDITEQLKFRTSRRCRNKNINKVGDKELTEIVSKGITACVFYPCIRGKLVGWGLLA